MERCVEHDLAGEFDLVFEPEGPAAAWCFPSRFRRPMAEVSGARVLLVEDEGLVALMLEDMLEELGLKVVASAAQVKKPASSRPRNRSIWRCLM